MLPMLRRAMLAATLAIASLPAVATAQGGSDENLLRRIALLERRANELEHRVRELESLLKAEPARARPTAATGNAKDVASWRRPRRGMTMDEVRAILGEPERVNAGVVTACYWGYASVMFDDDKVSSWMEPGR